MKRWKMAAALAAVFVSGLVIGGAGTGQYLKSRYFDVLEGPPGPPDAHIVARLSRELSLTPEQAERTRLIVERFSVKMYEIFLEAKPRMDAYLEAMAGEIAEGLDPGQRSRLERIVARVKSRQPPPPDSRGLFDGPPQRGDGAPPAPGLN